MLFWLGLPELGRNLVFLVSPCWVCHAGQGGACTLDARPAARPSLAAALVDEARPALSTPPQMTVSVTP